MEKEVGTVTTEMAVRDSVTEMPPVERLEPVHTKGLQRVFGVLPLAHHPSGAA